MNHFDTPLTPSEKSVLQAYQKVISTLNPGTAHCEIAEYRAFLETVKLRQEIAPGFQADPDPSAK